MLPSYMEYMYCNCICHCSYYSAYKIVLNTYSQVLWLDVSWRNVIRMDSNSCGFASPAWLAAKLLATSSWPATPTSKRTNSLRSFTWGMQVRKQILFIHPLLCFLEWSSPQIKPSLNELFFLNAGRTHRWGNVLKNPTPCHHLDNFSTSIWAGQVDNTFHQISFTTW